MSKHKLFFVTRTGEEPSGNFRENILKKIYGPKAEDRRFKIETEGGVPDISVFDALSKHTRVAIVDERPGMGKGGYALYVFKGRKALMDFRKQINRDGRHSQQMAFTIALDVYRKASSLQ